MTCQHKNGKLLESFMKANNKVLFLAVALGLSSHPSFAEEVDVSKRISEIRKANQIVGSMDTDIEIKEKKKRQLSLEADIEALKQKAIELKNSADFDAKLKAAIEKNNESHKSQIEALKRSNRNSENRLEDKIEELKAKIEKDKEARINEKPIFMTRVKGVGQNIYATIYYKDMLIERKIGQEFGDGIILDEIRADGATIIESGIKKDIPMQAVSDAYFLSNKAIGELIEESSKESKGMDGIPPGAMQLFPPLPNDDSSIAGS
jgi:hypothetical protein